MGIIDRYIIKKYLGTLVFMLLLLSIIVVVIDAQAKAPRLEAVLIEGQKTSMSYFLVHFYPFWIMHLIVTFMSILVFISVIYSTSRMANNTEIVAIISSGASFHRFARPNFMASGFIAVVLLVANHFLLPLANIKKNELEPYTYSQANREKLLGNAEISTQLSANEYIFINSYHREENRGNGFLFQKFDKNKKLIEELIANDIAWDEKKKRFVVTGYLERKATKDNMETIANGDTKELNFGRSPAELFPNELLGQTKTTPELLDLIKQEENKGNKNLNVFLNELHQRTSMPVAIVILSILALSLSSQKKRGGLGANLAIGITIAFVFVFSFEALKVVSQNNGLPPALAMWLPNIIFGVLAAYLYFKRANQ
ncbi:MAG: LptF/LptG family permease [Bergeyella zoohelcum]|nr:LptF/LptG family permease [Bergeyella zoohelcum]